MNLKKIELFGFKSFADKTEIEFKSNITGIVGPNGCGKSNVADAVRWVLGEQSPSVLRCKKMPEIIFGGTTNRKSMSYCEVSLFLDNEDRRYPVDYDEVVVTRKLYRSGDSEYYINRNICRWRDIIDLFRDSGIGREGYSIIGQGKIEEILSAKPEARRQIFEEAAGISRHKARKLETERKLERTRENLTRINDILSEVSSNLGPLEQEAKDAAKARELKNKLKQIEVRYFLHQCENTSSERDRIRDNLQKAIKEFEAKDAELKALTAEYNTAMADLNNSSIYGNRLRDNVTRLLVDAEKAAGESRLFAERLNNLRREAQNISTETIQLESRLAARQLEKEEKIASYNEKTLILAEKRRTFELLQKNQTELSDSVARQEKEIERTNLLMLDSMDKLSRIDSDKARLEIKRDVLIENIRTSKEALKEARQNLSTAEKERDGYRAELDAINKERNERQNEKALADKNLSECQTDLRAAQKDKNEAEQYLAALEAKIRMVEEFINDYTGYQESVRRLMNEAQNNPSVRSKILGTVGDVITVPQDLQVAVESALGAAIQNIITPNEHDAGALIDLLRQKGYGRATFLPLTTVRANPLAREHQRALDEDGVIGIASDLIRYDNKYSNVMSSLLGKTLIVENRDIAFSVARKYNFGFRIVDINGDIVSQSGSVSGGSNASRSNRILSRESELEDLKKKQISTKKKIDMLAAGILEYEEEQQKLEKAVGIIDARVHKLEVDIGTLENKLYNADSVVEALREDVRRLESGIAEDSAKSEELIRLIKESEKFKDDTAAEKTSASDYVNEAKDKLFNDKQNLNALNKRVTEAYVEVSNLQNEIDSINKDLAAIKAEGVMIQQSLLDLKARRMSNEKQLKDMEAQAKENSAGNEESNEEIIRLRKEIDDLEQYKSGLQEKLSRMDTQRTELNKLCGDINERRIREEANLERIDIDLSNLSVRIKEDYDLDYDSAKRFVAENPFDGEFDYAKAQQESLSLRRKIERLGPVNELAEQKFLNEKSRYDDLSRQYDDLVKAEAELKKIIEELTTEMTEKFTKSFAQINLNFQEVFKELFGGGSARLELEKEEGVSVLDAGIEIMAEPPGKKLTRISLMSGGERALTAIAILFAIIKLNPMPFSILDEIEAALDEANASLFAQYLHKFSKSTQFIVVTHRKPTMELADMLYGVTMQEKGISKLVSAKLEDAIKEVKGA
jgi:chromosome segregation protein